MSRFRSLLQPYSLKSALVDDRAHDCIVIDVARGNTDRSVASIDLLVEQVDRYVCHNLVLALEATKLYIVGDWSFTKANSVSGSGTRAADENERRKQTDIKAQWADATEKIKALVEQMSNLQELTWISGLPFTASLWEALPTTLTKLVLDLGAPVRLEQDNDIFHEWYISPDDMAPLQLQTKLKELRFFRVRDSIQSVVWETVFRNTSDTGMQVLDMQMAATPMVRSEEWLKANAVVGLNVPTQELEEDCYKGVDGKGVIHYSLGTGEYLDGYCIRKARIAAGLEEITPLPLWCLKLDGFVIDKMPFERELSRILLLTCGEKCIDSGLRAPKTDKDTIKASGTVVDSTTCHCVIQWPTWTGIVEDRACQHEDTAVAMNTNLSVPVTDVGPPAAPLTKESLHAKKLDDALDIIASDYFTDMARFLRPSNAQLHQPSESAHDSESTTSSPASLQTEMDGTPTTAATSFDGVPPTVDDSIISDDPLSPIESFEHVSLSEAQASTEMSMPTKEKAKHNKSTFTHKLTLGE